MNTITGFTKRLPRFSIWNRSIFDYSTSPPITSITNNVMNDWVFGNKNAFWYFSILGGLVLTVYAIHRKDPVFIFGQGLGLIIYFRNLHLHYRGKGRSAAS